MKILSAIVSRNAPVFEDTSHFLASRPSKKSVQAAIKAIIAFIAAWTDFFDGRLARKWNVSSKTGAFLDTIADKIFITFIFVGFTYIGRVSIWITVLLIAREFIITGLRGLAGNEGIMIPPSKFGKAKASLQFWAVGFVMMDFPLTILSFTIADLIVLHALIFSYISGYQYISGYLQQTK